MINKTRIQAKIARAISISPTDVTLMRTPKVDDGMNGYVDGEAVQVAQFQGLISLSGAKISEATPTDGGKTVYLKTVTMTSLVEDGYEILKDDYFNIGSAKYVVLQSIPMNGIYWATELGVEM